MSVNHGRMDGQPAGHVCPTSGSILRPDKQSLTTNESAPSPEQTWRHSSYYVSTELTGQPHRKRSATDPSLQEDSLSPCQESVSGSCGVTSCVLLHNVNPPPAHGSTDLLLTTYSLGMRHLGYLQGFPFSQVLRQCAARGHTL